MFEDGTKQNYTILNNKEQCPEVEGSAFRLRLRMLIRWEKMRENSPRQSRDLRSRYGTADRNRTAVILCHISPPQLLYKLTNSTIVAIMSVVGIDFGVKHCVIAAAGRGGVDVILNGNSQRLNP